MKMPEDPAAPCPCSSGLSYGECHKLIEEAGTTEFLDVSYREYARRWQGNASLYEAQGLYACLSAHILKFGPARRVIDIGSGRGQGLVELRKLTGESGLLLGIDENPDCLKGAAQLLGIANPATRLIRASAHDRVYDLHFVPGRLPTVAPVVLVQADMLKLDSELHDWILTLAPVDAVTMWFTGVHAARQYNKAILDLNIKTDETHRMYMNLATIALAADVLPSGGLLQIVGRGTANNKAQLVGDTTNDMRSAAKNAPFDVVNVELHRYREPSTGARIPVGANGISGHSLYATSTILRRRP